MNHEHTDACFAGPFGRTIHPRCGTMKFDARDLPPGWWKAQEEDTMQPEDETKDYWIYEEGRPNPRGPFESLDDVRAWLEANGEGWHKIASTRR